MAEQGYNLLNTGMIQKAVEKRDDILQKYDKINSCLLYTSDAADE